ncbi:MAG: hypothetical protein NT154_18280 [Verrucomicrobia bacterium]|nr:hypothetical protein [Verrucomicrobiota bacterium]
MIGDLERASRFINRAIEIAKANGFWIVEVTSLLRLVTSLRFMKYLRFSIGASFRALRNCHDQKSHQVDTLELEALHLSRLGLTLAMCGDPRANLVLRRGIAICRSRNDKRLEGLIDAYNAARLLWLGAAEKAIAFADRAWEAAAVEKRERDFVRAGRLRGEAVLNLNDMATAMQRLTEALKRARKVDFVEEELPALTALAEWHRQKRDFAAARELLEQAWEPAERGPYPLFHADARNILARIERDQDNQESAIAAATKAYTLAWCDGPPYAYHYGLTNARKHLQELGALEPQLTPFDASKCEPMHNVELNPKDAFWVDPDKLDSQS